MRQLNSLIQSNSTLQGAAQSTDTLPPSSPIGGATLGASPDASKMAGSQAQKLSALRQGLQEERDQTFLQKDKKKAPYAERLEQLAKTSNQSLTLQGRVSAVANQKVLANLSKSTVSNTVLNPQAISGLSSESSVTLNTLLDPSKAATTTSKEQISSLLNELGIPNANLIAEGGSAAVLTALKGTKRNGELLFKDISPQEQKDALRSALAPNVLLKDVNTAIVGTPDVGVAVTPDEFEAHAREIFESAGMEYNPETTSWGEYEKALSSWKESGLKDKESIDAMKRSTNPAVRAEAIEVSKEQGFLGSESLVQQVDKLDSLVEAGEPLQFGSLTINTADVKAQDVDALLNELKENKEFAESVEGKAAQAYLDSGRLEALLSPDELNLFRSTAEERERVASTMTYTDAAGKVTRIKDNPALLELLSPSQKLAAEGKSLSQPSFDKGVISAVKSPTFNRKDEIITIASDPLAKTTGIINVLQNLTPEQINSTFLIGNYNEARQELTVIEEYKKSKAAGDKYTIAKAREALLPPELVKAVNEAKSLNLDLKEFGGDFNAVIDRAINKFNPTEFAKSGTNPINTLVNQVKSKLQERYQYVDKLKNKLNIAVDVDKKYADFKETQEYKTLRQHFPDEGTTVVNVRHKQKDLVKELDSLLEKQKAVSESRGKEVALIPLLDKIHKQAQEKLVSTEIKKKREELANIEALIPIAQKLDGIENEVFHFGNAKSKHYSQLEIGPDGKGKNRMSSPDLIKSRRQ